MNLDFLHMSKLEFTKKIIMIILGCLLNATSVNLFIIPSKLLSGGLSGISLIFYYLFNIPVGILLILLNIPLLILSIIKTNKRFTLFSIIGTVALSLALIVTEPLSNVLSPVSNINRLLYSIYGGVLGGIGIGIVFSNQGSTGGIDIISMIVKQQYNMDIGLTSFIINFIIVGIGSIFFGIEIGLYTIIMMYISGDFVDRVLKGFSRQKMLIIVTKKADEVSSAIINKLHRGTTIIYGEGAYTKDKINIIYCVISPKQLPRIKQLVREVEENAFISITDTSEVQGKGFSKLM